MKLKAISNFVTSKVGRQILTVQKHSPAILFAAGVAGVVGTVVLASRATLKLDDVLSEAEEKREKAITLEHPDYSDSDRERDLLLIRVRTTAKVMKLYTPAAVIGVVSIAALTGSHVILTKRNLAVTAAYAALDKGFRQYRDRVVAELGEDKDKQFRYDMQEREIVEEGPDGPIVKKVRDVRMDGQSIYAKCFDQFSSSWSPEASYNQIFLRCQQNYANDLLNARGHVFLNEVYQMLGLPHTKEGAVVGWVKGNGDNFITFGIFEGDEYEAMRFVLGQNDGVWLDFNVDGIIYNKI